MNKIFKKKTLQRHWWNWWEALDDKCGWFVCGFNLFKFCIPNYLWGIVCIWGGSIPIHVGVLNINVVCWEMTMWFWSSTCNHLGSVFLCVCIMSNLCLNNQCCLLSWLCWGRIRCIVKYVGIVCPNCHVRRSWSPK